MNVSLNWLKDYLKIDQSTEEICKILTSIGLEVGGYEEFEAIQEVVSSRWSKGGNGKSFSSRGLADA